MNRPFLLLVSAVLVGMELTVRPALSIGSSGIAPSFLIPLVVFIAIHAPPNAAYWFALILGLLMDLLSPFNGPDAQSVVTVVGPNTLGYMAGVYSVLFVRGVMVLNNRLTLVVLSVLAGIAAALVAFVILAVRSIYDDALPVAPARELARALASGGYTGITAFVLSLALSQVEPLFGFPDQRRRR